MSEHVIALDPGGRSGWASARMDVDRLELTGTGVMRQDQMARWLANQQDVGQMGDREWPEFHPEFDVIVAESWRPRRINGSMNWIENDPLLSAQHLGQIRLIADLSGAKYVEYAPAQKPTWVASMPTVFGTLDEDSNEQHDIDARMHLWGYFFENWFTGTVDSEGVIV